jgi:hypothetical protein
MQHAVELRDRPIHVGNDRKVHDAALGFANVLQPLLVRRDRVDGQADGLDVASLELRMQQRQPAQLVVQTGVKSRGCENSRPQLASSQS